MKIQGRHLISATRFPSPHPRITLFRITYRSEGLSVKGLLAVPDEDKKRPGLLYCRGGIKKVGMVRIARVIQLASNGFVVMAPFYRGNEGGEGNEDFCGEDVADATSAYELLRSLACVDESNLHIFGFSRGGPMAYFTALKHPDVSSVVIWGGVSDMTLTYEERVDLRRMMKRVIGGTPTKKEAAYRQRSPLYYSSAFEVPLLLIHGSKDKNVSVTHSLRLKEVLEAEGKHVESWFFPQYNHHVPPRENRIVTDAFCRWMKTQQEEKPDL
ncbi:putative peptidase ytmA [Fictibacillus macauensis ZFHKF-1]|uniref:Putative peptidase ytmA n=1 Tax=Fictibacillus macauensis ZFHKF-1 TaxID=1196324 RepID=I8AJ72_9BACL|nr:prolyl oligopeptidase family serine peptidase [Fictibacillus macauensis]EIT85539.1 putative peptidase ytmA [Fictibacillus macauensis ZFHKF-1]